jgi:hypothetical protein
MFQIAVNKGLVFIAGPYALEPSQGHGPWGMIWHSFMLFMFFMVNNMQPTASWESDLPSPDILRSRDL